ncbi:n-alkane inducible cytochrome P-450 [Microsporum canis CBS 113480]|uniref:N-alkane inducible cytochrome P-450 n=1 Tax=Arthroderma otae (strain ATCC MYA-4605 / CBS 113480) TaxID=554155 RepID=C5FNT2_ARTOC|nr:n-alkane inducible cytochrome P-450 [Microsporum canis CBS 113480]EEQ31785.1 n-alkane inducible cytochrome P-450 [Microsporum canis CBS 113480]
MLAGKGNLLSLGWVLLGGFVLYRLALYVQAALARRRAAKEHGCKAPPAYPDFDPIFGLGLVFEAVKSSKHDTFLEDIWKRYQNNNDVRAGERQDGAGGQVRRLRAPSQTQGKLPDWEHSRSMLRPNFSRSQIADLNMFERHVRELIELIPTDGSTVDLQNLFFGMTLDSATEFLFGESASTLSGHRSTAPKGDIFGQSFDYCTGYIGRRVRVGLPTAFASGKYKQGVRDVHTFADHYVKKGIERYNSREKGADGTDEAGRYVFLDELVKETQDPLVLRSELMNILLAGRDTTASLLTLFWNTVSKRQDVWEKLQAEIQTLDGRIPSFEEIKELKYLRYTMNEGAVLRLYPVVPGNARSAIRDTILPCGGGPDGQSPVFVPKGTSVVYSAFSMHRRTDIYGPDALEFKPERWETLRPGWGYLPFNGGPRICLGQQFALTEASYATVRLMQRFRTIESRDPHPWTELLTVTCSSKYGAKVALR